MRKALLAILLCGLVSPILCACEQYYPKTVWVLPSGFVDLEENLDFGLTLMGFETQIVFFLPDGNDIGQIIYQTGFSDTDFIVRHKGKYFINEMKLREILALAEHALLDAQVVRTVPSGFIVLPESGKGSSSGLTWQISDRQILFLDSEGACIFKAQLNNADFIVKYDDKYYVNANTWQYILSLT